MTRLPPIESVLKRDRMIVLGALLALTAFAWIYVLWFSANMTAPTPMPDMPGMAMTPSVHPWTMAEFLSRLRCGP